MGSYPGNKFGWRPYLPKTEKDEKYVALFQKIHSFKRSSPYTRQYLNMKSLFYAKYVIRKYVRANLLVSFILTKFKFKYPPIFLIRHPIDTCLSQINAFKQKDYNKQKGEIPDWINNDRFLEHQNFIDQLESDLKVKIANWCLNNIYTLNEIPNFDHLIIVFYSDLLLNPEREIEKILDKLNFTVDKNIFLDSVVFRKASSTDFEQQLKSDSEEQLNKNFLLLDQDTKAKVQRIFDHFDFKLYDAYSPLLKKVCFIGK